MDSICGTQVLSSQIGDLIDQSESQPDSVQSMLA